MTFVICSVFVFQLLFALLARAGYVMSHVSQVPEH